MTERIHLQSPNSQPDNSSLPVQVLIQLISSIILSNPRFANDHILHQHSFVNKLGLRATDFLTSIQNCKQNIIILNTLVDNILEAWVTKNGRNAVVGILRQIFQDLEYRDLSDKLENQYPLNAVVVQSLNQTQDPGENSPFLGPPSGHENKTNPEVRRHWINPKNWLSSKGLLLFAAAVLLTSAGCFIYKLFTDRRVSSLPETSTSKPETSTVLLNMTKAQDWFIHSLFTDPTTHEITHESSSTPTQESSATSTALDSITPPAPTHACPIDIPIKILWENKTKKVTKSTLTEDCVHRWKHLESHLEHPSLLNFYLKYATNSESLRIEGEICSGVQHFNYSKPFNPNQVVTSNIRLLYFGRMPVECTDNLFMWIAKTINLTQLQSLHLPDRILISNLIVDSFNYFMSQFGSNLSEISLAADFTFLNESNGLFSNVSFKSLEVIDLNNTAQFGTVSESTMLEILKSSTSSPIVTIQSNLPILYEDCHLVVIFHKTLKYLNLLIYLEEALTFDFKLCFRQLTNLKSLSLELTDQFFRECSGKKITLLNFDAKYIPRSLKFVQIKSTCPLHIDNNKLFNFEFSREGKFHVYTMQNLVYTYVAVE